MRILYKSQGSLGIFHLAHLSVVSRSSVGGRYQGQANIQTNNYIQQKKETRMRLLVSPQGLEPWTH